MKKETLTKDNFKPTLLYVDEKYKTSLTDAYYLNIKQNNTLIEVCENLLKRTLTDKEILTAIKNPLDFAESVKDTIRSKFQFPESDQDFNLRALGLTFDNLNVCLNIPSKEEYKYIIDGNKLTPEPKYLKLIDAKCNVYTRNQKQNQALKIAKNLTKSAHDLIELGIANSHAQFNYMRGTNNLVLTGTNNILKINYTRILSLN